MKYLVLFLCIINLTSSINSQSLKKEPVDFVDPLYGTSSSHWMLFPGASMPAGMVKLSPDNQRNGPSAGYDYNISTITGFSHIHSWTMGGIMTMPTVGKLNITGYHSRFSHKNEIARPGYYSVFLDDYRIKADLTSTTRTGFQRYTFPESDSAHILIDLKIPTEYGYEIFEAKIRKVNNSEIEGYSVQQSLHGANFNEYTLHFVFRFNKLFDTFNGWLGDEIYRDTTEVFLTDNDDDIGAFLNFKTKEGEEILVQCGISLVSIDQARLNLDTELNSYNWNFDAVQKNNRDTWNNLLRSIEIEGGNDADHRKFYTGMYRSYTGQTTWSDVNGKYVDMNEKVQQLIDPDSPVYGSDASGNTFWNLNQLWTLSQPDFTNKYVKSLLEIYDKGGWLPERSEGVEYSGAKIPSHGISLMVSAYQKGIRNYDINTMYKAIVHNRTEEGKLHPGGGFAGNRNLDSYIKSGYIQNEGGAVLKTLGYAYDDWTVSQMAKSLGNESDFKTFTKRAFNYRKIIDTAFTFFVPQDMRGLINLPGKEEFVNRLDKVLEGSLPGTPGLAYMFNYAGKPWLTQKWIREIMNKYNGDPEQTAAWYTMSAIGLFEMDGGASINPFYEIGSPIFDKIIIHLDEKYYPGKTFTIETKNRSDENKYIQSASLDGKPLNKPWFYHSELIDGGNLILKMGPKPNFKWGSNPEDAPPSMSSLLSDEEIKTILKYDKFAEDLEAWNKALKAYYYHKKEHFESLPNTKNEIIFLGNSITDNCEWAELFSNPNIKNRGIGGDDTDGVLGRLTEVTESNPSKIFIMIGTNDLSYSKSIDYIVDNYKKIIAKIKQSTPGTEIYIQSIIPTDDAIYTTRKNSDIIVINDRLKQIAEDNGLIYVDLFSVFKLDNNKLNPEYSYDGLHLNGKGYLIWKKVIEKYIIN
jgi:predicted alpha-1,2-mannosidase